MKKIFLVAGTVAAVFVMVGGPAHAALPDGMLVRPEGSSKIYVIYHGIKQWIESSSVFQAYSLSWQGVKTITDDTASNLPDGPAISASIGSNLLAAISSTTSRSDTTRPTISDIAIADRTSSTAVITWNTNEPATGQIEFCRSWSHCGMTTPTVPDLVRSHTITLSGLSPRTYYYYRIRSADAAGNLRVSSANSFRTLRSSSRPTSTPTPAPTPVSIPTPSPTPLPTATVIPTQTPLQTPTPTATVTPTAVPATPTPTPVIPNPIVTSFDAQPRTGATSVTATFTAADTVPLATGYLSRAPYSTTCSESVKTACAWGIVGSLLGTGGTTWSASFTDAATGTFWYGVKVVDVSGVIAYEPTAVKVSFLSPATPTPAPTTPTPIPATPVPTATPVITPAATPTPMPASGSIYGMTIPQSHPRIFWTPARIAQAKSWWTTHSFTPNANSDTFDLLLAYEATGNNTYCTQAISQVSANVSAIAACSTTSNNGCDNYRWNGEYYILTYDWCYNMMSASQISTMESNLNAWVPANNAQNWGGPGMSQDNYYWGDVRNSLEYGVASYWNNVTVADAAIKNALVTRYQNDFIPTSTGAAAGGLALEGNQYGPYLSSYASTVAFPGADAMGRDIWNETPFWKGTVLNRIYMTPAQPTLGARAGWDVFPFNDDEKWENGAPAATAFASNFMVVAANKWSATNIGKWARQWLNMVSPTPDKIVQATDAGGGNPGMSFASLPLDYYDSGPKYFMGRNNWTADATSYMWQMGTLAAVGHSHNDWGTFQINRKGRWLTRETQGYTNTVAGFGGVGTVDTLTGLSHNVPIINGIAGVTGQSDGSPIVRRLESQPGYSFADVDLTGIYRNSSCCSNHPERGNAAAVHVEREYFFIRDIETTVILDRLESDNAARSKTFIFHCETNPVLVTTTQTDCVNGNQQLFVTTLLPASPNRVVVNEASNGAKPPINSNQYRIEVNDNPNTTQSYTLHVMQAMDTTGAVLHPTLVDNGSSWTITIDGSHSLTLNKGMSSSGGTITINGSTTTLRGTVQSMNITDSGPVWQ